MKDVWELYNRLTADIPADLYICDIIIMENWIYVYADENVGISCFYEGKAFDVNQYIGMSLKLVAELVKSWNFALASLGLAAINCYKNQFARIQDTSLWNNLVELQKGNTFIESKPFWENKKVATIGHFRYTDHYFSNKEEVYIIERNPKEGDFPDTACEYILPQVDCVFITGTTIINKTITRLLELSKNARVVIVGPSTPITPIWFEYGADELAGTVLVQNKHMEKMELASGKFRKSIRMIKK